VEPEPVTEPEPENNMSLILGTVAVLALAGGGALFYFKVLKPKKDKGGRVSELDDFDFDDEPEDLPYTADDEDGADDLAELDGQSKPYTHAEDEDREDGQ
jgi:hypothetical protein